MSKIKVLRIIHRFSISGPPFHVALLTKYLGPEFETKLIGGVPEEGEADSFYVLQNYGVKAIIISELRRNINPFSDFLAYRKIKQIIREYQPDIVHTHASKAGALGRLAASRTGAKIIVHTYHGHVFHSYFGSFKTGIYKLIERYLAKKSTGIIAISESQKNELSNVFSICPQDKIRVIPLGLELDDFANNTPSNRHEARTTLGIETDEIALGIIGRLAAIKDHLFFLEVVGHVLAATDKKIKVFIVGDGMERAKIRETANSINSNYPNTIVMTSWIREMAPIYHALDIVCLTSKNEGTPVTLIEAQAAGLPVISTDVGGVKDVIVNKKSGFLIPKNNLPAYLEKLLTLIDSEDLRKEFGNYGQNEILKRYGYQRLVSDMEEYYHELVNRS